MTTLIFILFVLSGCTNLYQTSMPKRHVAEGVPTGAVSGLIAGTTSSNIPLSLGVAIGSAFGLTTGLHYDRPQGIISILEHQNIQVVAIGDTTKVYLPADTVFEQNTSHIKRSAYPILSNVVKLAQQYNKAMIIVTGNTDNMPSEEAADLIGKNQARSVAAYLWAMGINDKRLVIETNGSKKPIASNHLLTGSEQNRHVLVKFDRLHT